MYLIMDMYHALAILSLIVVYASAGALIAPSSTPKICPPEPQGDEMCPDVCTTCDSLGRCIISNPISLVVAPDDRPTLVRCTAPGECSGIDILCSYNASCDVTCVAGACNNMWLDCGNSNHSCNVYCERTTTRLAGFVCNETSACNCKNTCGPSWDCTPGVNCRNDPCYRVPNEFSVCYPYRTPKSALNYTYNQETDMCDCPCLNTTEVAVDVDWLRYCVDPNALCQYDSNCNHGLCTHGRCECFNGWTGNYCDQDSCLRAGGSFCGPNGECSCTGGYSGPTCANQPTCNLTSVAEDPCPNGCHECIGDTCIVHVTSAGPFYSSSTITCPVTANQMRCLLICDTSACAGYHMTCSSDVACDFVCLDGAPCAEANMICEKPGVPCRAHCTGSTIASRSIGIWGCSNHGSSSCDLCDVGACLPSYNCTVGLDCPEDVCYMSKCNGGTFSVADWGGCLCQCPNGTFETTNDAGESTCLSTDQDSNCGCLDYANICINNTCVCPGSHTGPQCNSTLPSCPPLNTPDVAYMKPHGCDEWDNINFICTMINPRSDVPCPFGYRCVIKCYAEHCNGITVSCDNGAGPCDLYCFGQQACLMVTMKCGTSQPCNTHCSSTDPRKDQVLADHICEPFSGIPSCSCNSTCLMQANIQNPCYLTSSMLSYHGNDIFWSNLQQCGTDSQGVQLVPIPSADRSACNCSCPDPLDHYIESDNLCIPTCNPACDNGGQCILDTNVRPPVRRCLCFSGWTGRACTLRCFFPIPVEIVSCDNGIYIIASNMTVRSNETLLVLQDTPDAQVIRVNGSVIIQPNATVSFASNSSTVLQVQVGGDMTQQSNSTLKTSIVGATAGIAVGSNITIIGSVKLSGTLEVIVDPELILQQLQSGGGTVVFTALQYGQVEGRFDTVTTTLPSSSVLPDGCSQLVAQPQYESRGLNLIFSLDSSRCSPTELASSNPVAAAAIAATNTTAIVVGVAVPVVAIAIATAVILIKKKEMATALKRLTRMSQKPDTSKPTEKNSVEMTRLASSPEQNRGTWTMGKKGALQHSK